jgi:hypothetical protein
VARILMRMLTRSPYKQTLALAQFKKAQQAQACQKLVPGSPLAGPPASGSGATL